MYPDKNTLARYRDDSGLLSRIRDAVAANEVSALVGGPGCGKSFVSLLGGLEWEQTRDQEAHYARLPELQLTAAHTQWRDAARRNRHELWIVDNAQTVRGATEDLMLAFHAEFERRPGRHHLLFVSWTAGAFASGVHIIPMGLTPGRVNQALQARSLPALATDRARLWAGSGVGLGKILDFAEDQPDRLTSSKTGDVISEWLQELVSAIPAEDRDHSDDLVRDLAICGFLVVPYRSVERREARQIRYLADAGVLTEAGDGVWALVDDEHARALMIDQVRIQDLGTTFLLPVRAMCELRPAQTRKLVHELGRTTERDLYEWLGQPGGSARSLLELVVGGDVAFATRLAMNPQTPLRDSVVILSDVRDIAVDAVPIARQVLILRRTDCDAALAERHPRDWQALLDLTGMAEGTDLDTDLAAVLRSVEFLDAFRADTPAARGWMIKDAVAFGVRRPDLVGEDVIVTLIEAHLRASPAAQLWSGVRQVSPHHLAATLAAVDRLDLRLVAEAIAQAPARSSRALGVAELRSALMPLMRRAADTLTSNDLPRDPGVLNDMLLLAKDIGSTHLRDRAVEQAGQVLSNPARARKWWRTLGTLGGRDALPVAVLVAAIPGVVVAEAALRDPSRCLQFLERCPPADLPAVRSHIAGGLRQLNIDESVDATWTGVDRLSIPRLVEELGVQDLLSQPVVADGLAWATMDARLAPRQLWRAWSSGKVDLATVQTPEEIRAAVMLAPELAFTALHLVRLGRPAVAKTLEDHLRRILTAPIRRYECGTWTEGQCRAFLRIAHALGRHDLERETAVQHRLELFPGLKAGCIGRHPLHERVARSATMLSRAADQLRRRARGLLRRVG